jgi:hypothetical protein
MNRPTRPAIVALVGALLTLAACGSSATSSSSNSVPNTFKLSEFKIVPPANALRAGNVKLNADNVGGEVHELVLVRADSPDGLPMKSDGSVDEDKIAEADKVGEIADIAPGSQKSKTFDLAPGAYVAFCNVTDSMAGPTMMGDSHSGMGMGHVHFAQGMHATLTVS